ncbi:hypothetical protein M3Y94_01305200 [Aphelenchoides besseyi]|nr:hypothetical protein M3Y94_01305200 [Aphelenchoides besseyi]KAI6220218.1 hypothetical protein M3Y95_01061500 [Aphelenchoides besseyi]
MPRKRGATKSKTDSRAAKSDENVAVRKRGRKQNEPENVVENKTPKRRRLESPIPTRILPPRSRASKYDRSSKARTTSEGNLSKSNLPTYKREEEEQSNEKANVSTVKLSQPLKIITKPSHPINVTGVIEVVTLSSGSSVASLDRSISIPCLPQPSQIQNNSSAELPPPVATPLDETITDTSPSNKTLIVNVDTEEANDNDSTTSSIVILPMGDKIVANGKANTSIAQIGSSFMPRTTNSTEGLVKIIVPASKLEESNGKNLLQYRNLRMAVDFPPTDCRFAQSQNNLDAINSSIVETKRADSTVKKTNELRSLASQIDYAVEKWKKSLIASLNNTDIRLKQLELVTVLEVVEKTTKNECTEDDETASMCVNLPAFDAVDDVEFHLDSDLREVEKQELIKQGRNRPRCDSSVAEFIESSDEDSADEEDMSHVGLNWNDCYNQYQQTPMSCGIGIKWSNSNNQRFSAVNPGTVARLLNRHTSNDPWRMKSSVDWWAVKLINNYNNPDHIL